MVWGGHLLAETLGKPASKDPIGESWEVWEGDPVDNAEFSDDTLGNLANRFPTELMGSVPVARGWRRFPLLTKFIDASEPLSVQVHPNDAQAQRLEGQPNGKTEAWYILSVRPDSWIIHGLTTEVDRPTLRKLLEEGKADDLLRKVRLKPGDTIFVPAGTVHAIGPGVLLHEVQQTSDVTYRLYDWNRQAHGSTRELHLDKGLEVSRLTPSQNPTIRPLEWTENGVQVALVLASPYFTVKRIRLPGAARLDTGGKSFQIVTILEGTCRIESDGHGLELGLGESVVVPACIGGYSIGSQIPAVALLEYISDSKAPAQELAQHGFKNGQISAFLDQFACC